MASGEEKLSENMEDYLEVIHLLARGKGMARVGQIASKMDVKSPSVHAALKGLAGRGFVEHEKYGYVTLTEKGRKRAAEVQEKHDILFRFMTEFLMLAPDVAAREACSIEHAISRETFVRLVRFFKFLEAQPGREKPKLLKDLGAYLKSGRGR
jgi:DtxR family Mn-dependent transcriptional regulator